MRTVIGMNDPNRDDAPYVQNAVDKDTQVKLDGRFFFKTSVTINKAEVEISEAMPGVKAIIEGGQIPFVVDVAGKPVTIRGLHFVRPKQFAIQVKAVNKLLISLCKIEGPLQLVPQTIDQRPNGKVVTFDTGGGINISGGRNTTGQITISQNEFNIGGGPVDRTYGVLFNTVGDPASKVDIRLTGNTVQNVTAHGLDLREITGTAIIENNRIETGAVGGRPLDLLDRFVDGIRCVGVGAYQVRGNQIKCQYEDSAGIRLQGNSLASPIKGAIVSGNGINMSTQGRTAGSENAGIEIRRNCGNNSASNNKISGDARAALSLIAEPNPTDVNLALLMPGQNALTDNFLNYFSPSSADIFVGENVDRTFISSYFDFPEENVKDRGRTVSIIDEGSGTSIRGYYTVLQSGSLM